jgi:hydrogenase maturation protease
MTRTLIAGVGDIFLSDDGFGCEVIRRLAARALPDDVTARDFGIGGIHLAYELLDGWDRLVLVDALPRGEPPGTLSVLRPDAIPATRALPDAHGMYPLAVFDYVATIGGAPVPTLVVGCEPASTDEAMGLTPPVEAAVDPAVELVLALLRDDQASRFRAPALVDPLERTGIA